MYNGHLILRDTDWDQPSEETHMVRSGRIPDGEPFLPWESGYVIFLEH